MGTTAAQDRPSALSRHIAASAAAVLAFHGILHEVAGPTLFPWAPIEFGPVLWHGMGIAVLVLGLLCWGGVTGLLRFPVVPVCVAIALFGLGIVVYVTIAHAQFHFFALFVAAMAVTTAVFHRRAAR